MLAPYFCLTTIIVLFLKLLLLRLSTCHSAAGEGYSQYMCGGRPLMLSDPHGHRLHPRIKRVIGGEGAKLGEFPWQAAVGAFEASDGQFYQSCSGALVHPRWVLTAAHCVVLFAADQGKRKANMTVRLGMTDYFNVSPVFPYSDIQVAEWIVHEGFTIDRGGQNDIALLKLAKLVPVSPHIVPVCVAPQKKYTGSFGTLTGWGQLFEGGPMPHVLQKTRVPFIDNKDCQSSWTQSSRVLITPDLICSMDRNGGRGACAGDSGGPIAQELDGRWVLVGITSGRDVQNSCGPPYLTGLTVYAFVPVFSDWIQAKTNGDVQPYN